MTEYAVPSNATNFADGSVMSVIPARGTFRLEKDGRDPQLARVVGLGLVAFKKDGEGQKTYAEPLVVMGDGGVWQLRHLLEYGFPGWEAVEEEPLTTLGELVEDLLGEL